jgi:hypothetical protein
VNCHRDIVKTILTFDRFVDRDMLALFSGGRISHKELRSHLKPCSNDPEAAFGAIASIFHDEGCEEDAEADSGNGEDVDSDNGSDDGGEVSDDGEGEGGGECSENEENEPDWEDIDDKDEERDEGLVDEGLVDEETVER